MSGNTMLTNAVAAIRDALATEAALADAQRGMRSAWAKAYAATRTAQDAGQSQADIGKAAKVSAATVGDYLTASGIHASAWDVLDVLPARQGVRFTTVHSLVAGARKSSGTPKVREIIADASAKVRDIPREDGATPDPERVAKVWASAVRKLWEASAKPKAVTEPTEPTEPAKGATEPTEPKPEPTEPEAPTLNSRVLKLAAECGAVRLALSGGGAVDRKALAALQREAAQLARDVAGMLTPEAGKATA